jgi:hypothetical protein
MSHISGISFKSCDIKSRLFNNIQDKFLFVITLDVQISHGDGIPSGHQPHCF